MGKKIFEQIEQLSISEIHMFSELSKVKSVREMARRHNTSPAQISRLIKKIEDKIGFKLLERSLSGIELNQNGNLFLSKLHPLLSSFDELKSSFRGPSKVQSTLGIGSTSFLTNRLIAPIIEKMEFSKFNVRPRLLDVSPDQMTSAGLRNAFSLCVHIDQLEWPSTWMSEKIGDLQWILICNKNHPVLENSLKLSVTTYQTSKTKVLEFPFVYPCYWTQEGVNFGNDFYSIPISQRIRGCETSTAEMALKIVLNSNELAFVPYLLAKTELQNGDVKQVVVKGVPKVSKPVFFSFKTDQITTGFFKKFKAILIQEFSL